MGLFIIGSVGCALSTSISQIVFWRVFQALGACTGPHAGAGNDPRFKPYLCRADAINLNSDDGDSPNCRAADRRADDYFASWHLIFWLLAVIGLAMFIMLFWLPEPLPVEKREKASSGGVFRNYGLLLTNVAFMRYTLCLTFCHVAIYAFITGSPFVYISYFGVEAQHYGWLFALNIVGVMVMSVVNRRDRALRAGDVIESGDQRGGSGRTGAGGRRMVPRRRAGLNCCGDIYSVFTNGIIAATSTAAALDAAPNVAGSAWR